MPVVITFEVADNTYTVTDFWVPRDGSYYVSDIRDKFPDEIEEDALDTQKYVVAQIQECYSRAVQYYQVDTEAVIEELFDKMEASPATASNPADYIDAHSLEYRELMYYGPVEDGDQRLVSLNYVKVGDQSLYQVGQQNEPPDDTGANDREKRAMQAAARAYMQIMKGG